jgi:hypothetical protein
MSNATTAAVETLQLISPYGGEPAIFNVHVDVKIPVTYTILLFFLNYFPNSTIYSILNTKGRNK